MCDANIPQALDKRRAKRILNPKHAEPRSPPKFHVILFSHSPPNTFATSQWNLDSNLDNLSWDKLPEELQKRQIHLHTILMNPTPAGAHNVAVLQTQSCAGWAHQGMAWFPVPAGHKVFISGIPKAAAALQVLRLANAKQQASSTGKIITALNVCQFWR